MSKKMTGMLITVYVPSYKRQGWSYTSGGVQTYLPYYENHSDYTNVMTNHTLNTGESYYVRTDNTSNFAGVFTAQVKNSGGTLLGNLIVTARLGG